MPAPYDYSSSSGYTRMRADWISWPDTSTPITEANLDKVDQAVYDLKFQTYNVRDFGATGDGTTDDTTAIQNALSGAGAVATGDAAGAIVLVPTGSYIVTSQLVVPNKVRLVGAGRSATVIKAGATFPTSTALIQLGTTDAEVFGCRIENLTLHLNSISGSKGVYSQGANEGSGVRSCVVSHYMSRGIDIEDGATSRPDHFLIDDTEVYCSASATASVGVRINYQRNGGLIRRLTVNPQGAPADQATGVHVIGTVAGVHVQIIGANIERHTDGILFDTNSGGTVIGASLLTSGTNLVRIVGSHPVSLMSLTRSVGTNLIKNDVIASAHITATKTAFYLAATIGGTYQIFNFGGDTGSGTFGSAGEPVVYLKSTATSTSASRSSFDMRDGNGDGWRIQNTPEFSNDPLRFLPITGGSVGSSAFTVEDTGTLTIGASGPTLRSGSGSPEGAVTAIVGSLFLRTDGGTSTTLYVKESGAGNTGWVAK